MFSAFISPSRYIQGAGALNFIGEQVSLFGSRALVIGGRNALAATRERIEKGLAAKNVGIAGIEQYCGESTLNEMKRLAKMAEETNANVVIGVGGGKAVDTAKGISHFSGLPLVIVPTTASNDAPCSSLAVVYSEAGVIVDVLFLKQNPSLVLVDTEIIANAPVRQFVAGMGDALATWFEARSCAESGFCKNFAHGRPLQTATTLAHLCYQTLIKHGVSAKIAVEQKLVTPALEKVVEANILLSGLGFESGGVSGAHGTVEGFTVLHGNPKYHLNTLHGEEVAFGTIVLLAMEGRPLDEIQEVLAFSTSVGLPTTFADLGLDGVSDEDLWKGSEAACTREIIHNLNFEVTPVTVYNAVKTANAIGQSFKKGV